MDSSGKTLVTGATGFVGAAVARALIARGKGSCCWRGKILRAAMSKVWMPKW